MNIVTPDAALVRDVHQDGFVLRRGKEILAIRSVSTDTAARRIVVVVENGKNLNSSARKVEASVLSTIVTNARAEDSFAFLTALGPRKELPFGTPRDVLLSAIGGLSSPEKGKDQTKPVLDVVFEAAGLLQPSQPGDSIILVTMGLRPGEAGYSRASKTLTANGIRLFGFQLGVIYEGSLGLDIAPSPRGYPLPKLRFDPNRETAFDLADETGGFLLGENTEGVPHRSYQLTDQRLHLLDKFAGQLYKGIMEYYRLRLVDPQEGFAIDVSDRVRQKVPKARTVYPRIMPRCLPANTGG